MATSPIDLSSGLVPKQSNVDLSAGFVPRDQTEQSHWYTDVGDTLGREASSMGENIAGIPGGIYHAFADDPTPEETQEAGGPQEVSGAKRIGLGVGRLTAQPLVNAVRWYRDAAQGKVPDPVGQALSVAPEAMGAGAASVVAPRLAQEIPGALRAATPPLVRGVARGTNKVLAAAPGVVGGAAGHAVAGWPGAAVGYALGKEILPKFKVPGENFGQPEPVFSKTRLGPDAPPPEVGQSRGLGGHTPLDAPSSALGSIPATRQPLVEEMRSLPRGQYEAPASPLQKMLGEGVYEGEYMDQPPPQAPTIRGALPRGQYAAPASSLPPPRQLGAGSPPKLVDQIMERTTADEPYPRLIDQIKAKASPEISRPVTENPVVGSLVRAMQKSGLPIAERPNLLLKGSGRVNRILGPEEELTGPLEKSLRKARRQREQ